MTVLIVDDDTLICNELKKEVNRDFFFTIFTANDGASALEIFNKEPIDIVILDINLPDQTGIEVLKLMKDKKPQCEVIVVTGFGSQDYAISALKWGAIDYLDKPIVIQDLRTAIGRAQEKIAQKADFVFQASIMVVDDDETIVSRLKRALENENYQVFGAYGGIEALAIIEKNKIDVVITDLNMKDMSGIDVLQKVKKLYPDIEGIVVTGTAEQEKAVQALRAGAADYIVKPIDLDELIIAIEKALERISLYRNQLFRNRELKISAEIISKMNEELERRVEERSKELNQVQSQLFQTSKLATLGEMSAGLAHEINQPLGGIALVAKTMRKLDERNKLTHDELIRALNDIDTSVHRMTKIIQHIRVFARQDTLKFVEVDVNKTINSAISLLGEQLRLHSIPVETKLSGALPKILGEPNQLEQVWINLITNARDALDQKESLPATPPQYRKRLLISTGLNEDGRRIIVQFNDNGVGIPEKDHQKVFEPFFTTKVAGKGSGLGLSISYGLIDSHKGDIKFVSEPSGGVSAIITLPVKG